MAGRTAIDLDANEIVDAAIELLLEQGLDSVSMRNVGARLGVSPVPVYSRIGNKATLLDAIVDRMLADLAPTIDPDESWRSYAIRWCRVLHSRFVEISATGLVIGERRPIIVDATRPLVKAMRAQGLSTDCAVRATRLLVWTVAGFAAVQGRAGRDASGVTADEADRLFDLELRYLLDGIERDIEEER